MTDFQMKDTTQIQLDSLLAVMEAIGYRVDRAGFEGDERKPTGGFVTENKNLQGNRNLGLSNAIKIHNAKREDWVEVADGWYKINIPGVDIIMSAYALNILFARKLVEAVKFVKDRKTPNHIRLQSHMVKPASQKYTTILGLEA